MRKIVLFVGVLLFMAVPAMAASEVTITCDETVVGDVNWVTVSYSSDTNRIRAFGLDITLDVNDGNIIDVCDVDPNYRIFPGQISIVDGDVNDYYECYDPCDLGDANLAVEMGSLYTFDTNYIGDGNAGYGMQPGLSGTLMKFAYEDAGNFTIDVNVRRGGVVMEDPYETPDVNISSCQGGPPLCTVPDIIGMTQAAAEAAITGAGLTVGTVGKTASCGAVADFTVATQNPTNGGNQVDCGTAVDFDICECYYGQADYDEWEDANKPICWCYPRQCHGDADGEAEGNVIIGYAYVEQADLDLLGLAWKVKDPTHGPGILNLELNGVPAACADFDHQRTGNIVVGYARVEQPDLDIMGLAWKVKEPTKGPGVDPNCSPGNRTP